MPRIFSAWVDGCVFLVVYGVSVAVMASYNIYMGAIGGVIWLLFALFVRERCRDRHDKFESYFRDVVSNINSVSNYAIDHLPQAVLIVDAEGYLRWSNAALDVYLGTHAEPGTQVQEFWPNMILKPIWGMQGEYVFEEAGTYYKAIYRPVGGGEDEVTAPGKLMAFYVTDITEFEEVQSAYHGSRMAFAYIEVDNFDEVLQGLTEAERTALLFDVNRLLDAWTHQNGGFLRRVKDDLYIAVLERRALENVLRAKFDILDQVRSLRSPNHLPVTLSFGVAVADKQMPIELSMQARQELDLALGRGGDQAVVLIDGKLQFFGGKVAAVEKHTRVKARVVAHSLRDLIEAADEVYVMGHQNEDFDALGASVGVARMVRHLNKPVHILLSPQNDGIDKFIGLPMDKAEYQGMFVRASDVLDAPIPAHPLLIVVDTHIPHLVASPKLLARINRVVVIDHHRRSESCIESPLLLYVEPSSSSTSELVTELLMYFSEDFKLSRLDATALYAGIIVDTKNFLVQSGVRTFEAAAFLRRSGADPVVIRHLFRADYETNVTIAKAQASSKLYEGGLIVTTIPESQSNVQVIAAQVADSLLRIEGVRMSIVVFKNGDVVGISARAAGELNVQVIMEAFGGGGHQSVAGAQVKGGNFDEIHAQVIEQAKLYLKENG